MGRWPRTLLTLPAACGRLLVMLALLLLPLGGHPAAMVACAPAQDAAMPPHAASGAHHHGMDHASGPGDHAHAGKAAADHAPPAKAQGSHALCCLSTCPACLWQEVAAPSTPAPTRLAADLPPADTPVPPGHAPSPALDPPRTPA